MTFKGFDPRTRLARWGLVAVAVGIVLGGTGPSVVRDLGAPLGGAPLEPAVAARTPGGLPGLRRDDRLGGVRAAALDEAPRRDRAPADLVRAPPGPGGHRAGLAGVHGALLGLDATVPFSLPQMAVPGLAPYAPLAVAFGQLTFYVTAIVVASFYARRLIGQRAWRALHVLTFLAFAGATAHGILAGSDSGAAWTWWMYSGSVALVTFLFAYRLVTALARRGRSARQQVLRLEAQQLATARQVERHLTAHDRSAELGRRVIAGEQLGGGLG